MKLQITQATGNETGRMSCLPGLNLLQASLVRGIRLCAALLLTIGVAHGVLAQAPAVTNINPYLIIGMRPSSAGEAVTIGSSQEIGADRQTLSGDTPSAGQPISPVEPTISPAYPAPYSPDLRDVYFPDPSAPTNPSKNRWFWDSGTPKAHYLPGPGYPGDTTSRLFLFRGVDWSGDVAVTSASGRFSLQDINVFGQFGFKARNQSAPANVSNSRYFDAQSGSPLTGVSMDSLDDSSPRPDSPTQGWDGGVNLDPLLADLRLWRTFIRNLPRDTFFNSGDPSNPRDLVNRNTINAGGSYTGSSSRLVYDVNGLDSNNDG